MPDAVEAKLLAELFVQEEAYYRENLEEARKLLKIGEFALPSQISDAEDDSSTTHLPVARLAALTNVIVAILNLDATVWNR